MTLTRTFLSSSFQVIKGDKTQQLIYYWAEVQKGTSFHLVEKRQGRSLALLADHRGTKEQTMRLPAGKKYPLMSDLTPADRDVDVSQKQVPGKPDGPQQELHVDTSHLGKCQT